MRSVFAFLLVASAAASACSPTRAPRAEPPKWEPQAQTKCDVTRNRSRPLIVEWPSPDRSALEAQAQRGVVAVHYVGCQMEVLRRCQAPGKYAYGGVTRKEDHVAIRTNDELYASVPVHAVELEGKLAQAGRLDVNMIVVGTYESDAREVRRGELTGPDCVRATHFVSAMTVGAFEFSAGGSSEARGGASVLGAGVGAGSASTHEILNRDGAAAACEVAKRVDAAPPEGCGALLRVEVAPIAETGETPPKVDLGGAPPPRAGAAPSASPPPTPFATPAMTWVHPSSPPVRGETRRAVGTVLYGVGGAGLAVGLSTAFVALVLHASLTDGCPNRVCPPAKQSSVDSFHTVATIATWSTIGGAVLVAGGVTLSVTAPDGTARLTVAPRLGLGTAALGGTF